MDGDEFALLSGQIAAAGQVQAGQAQAQAERGQVPGSGTCLIIKPVLSTAFSVSV